MLCEDAPAGQSKIEGFRINRPRSASSGADEGLPFEKRSLGRQKVIEGVAQNLAAHAAAPSHLFAPKLPRERHRPGGDADSGHHPS